MVSPQNMIVYKRKKSIEPLDGMNDLWKPLNKLGTKINTLKNSKVPAQKFISSSPLINLDDYENEDDNDNEEEDDENLTLPNVKEHKVSKQNILPKIKCCSSYQTSSSSSNNNTDKGKWKKG